MPTQRQKKIGQLMQEVLAEQLKKDLDMILPKNTLVTVCSVDVTVDLGVAFVYLSIFPFEKSKEVLELIESQQKNIKRNVGNSLSKSLRRIPNLFFKLDDSLERLDDLNRELRGKGDNPIL